MNNPAPQPPRQLSTGLLAAIALLAAAGPFAIDMYLPTLPEVGADLAATASAVQWSLAAFLIGMAAGQLLTGSLSDGYGRKVFLVSGSVLVLAASLGCAFAPNITVLIIMRLLHGLGAGSCIVAGRAIIPDLASGRAAAQAFTLVMVLQGLAPVIAPIVGGILAGPIGWRGIFLTMAGLSVIQLLVAIFILPESRPPAARTGTSFRAIMGNYAAVLSTGAFVSYTVTFGFGFSVLFIYISASPFVIQNELGFSQLSYSIIFAANAAAMMVGGLINNRMMDRYGADILLGRALMVMAAGITLLIIAVRTDLPTWLFFSGIVLATAPTSALMANAIALGVATVRRYSGSGSAIMGFAQFGCAGVLSPLAGNATDMVIGMACCLVIAAGGLGAARYFTARQV